MQAAEKLTPTFVIKLILLFALLLTGVFMRSNKVGLPADAKNVQKYEQRTAEDQAQQERQDARFRLVKNEKADKASI